MPPKRKRTVSTTPGTKRPRPCAAPDVYAHLAPVPDHLGHDLNIVFCGINPGERSSTSGHHYAHPTNKFWRALHQSGITSRLLSPADDHLLPERFRCGLTNLCDRPTREQSELSTHEMRVAVPDLLAKIAQYRPGVVCFVGKKIWDVCESVAGKTAGPPTVIPLVNVKTEADELQKIREEPVEPADSPSTVSLLTLDNKGRVKIEQTYPSTRPPRQPRQPRTERSPHTPTTSKSESIDWTKPRELRLPHDRGYTYFWVTPSTSGLERTPLSEQVVIFLHLGRFAQSVEQGRLQGTYRDISLKGTLETVDKIKEATLRRGKV